MAVDPVAPRDRQPTARDAGDRNRLRVWRRRAEDAGDISQQQHGDQRPQRVVTGVVPGAGAIQI